MQKIKIAKAKPRGKPFAKGFDERRNIDGAPVRGESQAEVYTKLMNLPAEDLAEYFGLSNELGRAFAKMPKGVPLKILMAGRNIAAEMFEPSTSRMQMIMDRTEGKVVDKLDVNANTVQRVIIEYEGDNNTDTVAETPPSTEANQSESQEV